jgi:uncharacterized membrane protein
MLEIFCFTTLFLTIIVSTFFGLNRTNNLIINYIKKLFIVILLLFSIFNILIGIYWILDLNNDWSSIIQTGFEKSSNNKSITKGTPIRHYLIYIIPYVFLLCGVFTMVDFFKKIKKI